MPHTSAAGEHCWGCDWRCLDAMRYAYGAITFLGTTTLVFLCLLALEKMLS
jgi:hypothetical protein